MTITMYGADWCVDCLRAKAFFDECDVAYDYVDLAESPASAEIVLERNNGNKRIPVIVFPDDSHLTEPSNEALAAKLAEVFPDKQCAVHASKELKVVENSDESQFELRRDGEVVSVASFGERGDTVVIPHVGTEPQYRGQGYASKLMDGVIEILRETDRKIMPLCPFAASYMRDNPQHQDILA